jgi:hypothetical protein
MDEEKIRRRYTKKIYEQNIKNLRRIIKNLRRKNTVFRRTQTGGGRERCRHLCPVSKEIYRG